MAKLGPRECTSDNLTVTVETILKDKKSILREEQTAFECHQTRPSPSLQATNDPILTPQHPDKPHIYRAQVCYSECVSPLGKKDCHSVCWENSNQRHAGQNLSHDDYTALFSGNNHPLNLTVHRTVNSTTHNIMHNWHQQVSSVNTLPNNCIQRRMPIDQITFRPSVPHQAGLRNGSSKNCTSTYKLNVKFPSQPAVNVQSNVLNANKTKNESVPLKKRKQYFVTVTEDNNPGYEKEDKRVSLDKSYFKHKSDSGIRHVNSQFGNCHIGTSVGSTQPYQKMYISQKAIAVVAPLAPEAVERDKSSEKNTKVNEGGLKTRYVAEKPYHEHPLQSRTNEHGSESCSTSCSVAQAHYRTAEMPTQSIPDSSEPEDPVQTNELSRQGQSLYSVPVGSISMTHESMQSSNMDKQCSVCFLCEDVTTTNQSNDCSENAMDTAADKWSLKRLHKLVIDLERRQRTTHKEVPFTDLSSEIVRLFWNGDYQQLCDTARSDHYVNIMKEAVLYRGKENPVILQECSKEKFNRGAEDIHNSKQNPVLPTVESSLLILSKELSDSNKKRGDLSCLMNTADVAGDKTVKGGEIKKTKAFKAASGTGTFSQAQSQLLPVHEENSKRVVGDRVLTDPAKQMSASELNEVKTRHKDVPGEMKKMDQAIAKPRDCMPEDEAHTYTRVKPAENTGRHTSTPLEKYCCLNKWIQVLGYACDMCCTCERNSSKEVIEEMSMTGENMAPSPTPGDGSMDELEIVEVISDYENVRKIANAISDQQLDKPLRKRGPHAARKKEKQRTYEACRKQRTEADLIPNFSHDVSQMDLSLPTHGLHINEKGKKTTTPVVQKEERMVNLVLYGSSGMTHNRTAAMNSLAKKRLFGIRSYDGEHFPPAMLNVRVSPCLTDVNSNKRQTAKQHVLKSWRNSLVTTKMFTGRKRSKKLKCQQGIESQTEAAGTSGIEMSTFPADQQSNPAGQSRIKRHSKRRGQIKKRILDSVHFSSGQNIHKRKTTGSSCELPCTMKRRKPESHTGLALDFSVLPKSFSFMDARTSMDVHPSSDTDYVLGQKTIAEKPKNGTMGKTGVWCVSPKKKGHLKSILASEATSTFQEFKRKYEEKKQILHPKAAENKK
ncbi:uncharacterized protein [Salminus brasiliensis]|uniref:uncharacterized protein n=1 Tax=Salminus brasiliensis TaxID=930266 RepID=UPI003B8349CB